MFDCPQCKGAGEVMYRHFSGDPQLDVPTMCPTCLGDGELDLFNLTLVADDVNHPFWREAEEMLEEIGNE